MGVQAGWAAPYCSECPGLAVGISFRSRVCRPPVMHLHRLSVRGSGPSGGFLVPGLPGLFLLLRKAPDSPPGASWIHRNGAGLPRTDRDGRQLPGFGEMGRKRRGSSRRPRGKSAQPGGPADPAGRTSVGSVMKNRACPRPLRPTHGLGTQRQQRAMSCVYFFSELIPASPFLQERVACLQIRPRDREQMRSAFGRK